MDNLPMQSTRLKPLSTLDQVNTITELAGAPDEQ